MNMAPFASWFGTTKIRNFRFEWFRGGLVIDKLRIPALPVTLNNLWITNRICGYGAAFVLKEDIVLHNIALGIPHS